MKEFRYVIRYSRARPANFPWISIKIFSRNLQIFVNIISMLFFYFIECEAYGESIVIGLAASSTPKGPQVKTTEPMLSIKVTNCGIQLGWILARDGFAKNYMGSRPEAKKCQFFI